jgi:DNA-dependent protein kinase catalytic subunit
MVSYSIHCATEQCEDQLRNYCLARFEDLEDRIGCQQTTPPPPVIGSTYVRWGRTVCANDTGAVLVYSGRAAGSSYAEGGGGADMLCLPDNPQYLNRSAADTVQGHSPLTGAEFHTWVARPDLGLQNCPCAVCYVPRTTSLMIPARLSCPPSWTLEYIGYLMSKYRSQGYLKYECLDENPEFIPGLAGGTGAGVSIHLVEATCNTGLPCPPYSPTKEVGCAVCTK